jgi:hypothetical protein
VPTSPVGAAAFAEAARRYSVFYQPTGDGRATARVVLPKFGDDP